MDDAHSKHPVETGGVLMGYWSVSSQVVITRAISAGPDAKHHRMRFVPDYAYQEREIATIYRETGGQETYLGDWHTHPNQENVRPSFKDRVTLKRIATSAAARAPRALMMIVGGRDEPQHARIWSGTVETYLGLFSVLQLRPCVTRIFEHQPEATS